MESQAPSGGGKRARIGLGLILSVLVLAVYWPVLGFDFVIYDDPEYVTDNPQVLAGLTRESVHWAFTEVHAANWHPLTWISHQLDITLWGEDAGPHHGVNLGLHLACSLLLFGLMGALGLSALAAAWVAAIFALHPMHVESVAWISERKDVLSTFFGLIALRAYVRYARDPSALRYGAVTLALALGLLSKPMLVSLPILFLLLDLWPLGRVKGLGSLWHAPESWRRPLLEKLPWVLLAAASALVTLGAQEVARSDLAHLDMSQRMRSASVGLARYLGKFVWPAETAVLYPHPFMPGGMPVSSQDLVVSLLVVAVITICVFWSHARGWPVVGWLWFLVVLLPVLGLVQVGSQAIADRYTYVSYVGLSILAVQCGIGLARRSRPAEAAVRVVGVSTVLGCALATRPAVAVWKDSESLITHAIEVEPQNPIMYTLLGALCDDEERFPEARDAFRTALEYWPDMYEAQLGLAKTLNRAGKVVQATAEFERAIALNGTRHGAYTYLGLLVALRGDLPRGLELLERAIELEPESGLAYRNLGLVHQMAGRKAEAVVVLERGAELGTDAIGLRTLGGLLAERGDWGRLVEVVEPELERLEEELDLRWMCAQARSVLGDTEGLMVHLERLRQAEPSAATEVRAGGLLQQAGKVGEARRAFEAALRLDPTSQRARAALEGLRGAAEPR